MPPLPVEVCQAILRHSIYIPGFFDPDAFEGDLMAPGFGGSGAVAEESYWRAEKTRNILRRVCWGWNTYLLGFEHRFVNMSDVMHGRVDKMFLKKAMRISLVQEICWCTHVCVIPSPDDYFGRRYVFERFAEFCWETILPFRFLSAEIVHIESELTRDGDIIELMRVLKQAKVVISSRFHRAGFTPSLFTQTTNLEHMHGHLYQTGHLELTAQNLVTVSFQLEQWLGGEEVILELPSLRHLRIDSGQAVRYSEYFRGLLMPLLEKVGDQLRSLYLDSRDYGYHIPAEIWDKCPNLERFHPGMVLAVSPPMSHPVHTLSVMPGHLSRVATLQFPNLRRLILDGHWRKIESKGVTDLVSISKTSLIDRVTVEDLDGISLADAPNGTDTAAPEDTNTELARLTLLLASIRP